MSARHLVKSCNRLVTFALSNFGLFTLNRNLNSLLFINSVIPFIYLRHKAEENACAGAWRKKARLSFVAIVTVRVLIATVALMIAR